MSITVASAEGPAMRGMASGTMKGSTPPSSPKVPFIFANTMRIAIMKRITPPAIDSDVCDRCMSARKDCPPNMKARSRP